MKHDKNLVVKKDIQVSFYKLLLFALLLHIYDTVFILEIFTWYLYCKIWHGIYIEKFDMVFILQQLAWYLFCYIWHVIHIALFDMVFIL